MDFCECVCSYNAIDIHASQLEYVGGYRPPSLRHFQPDTSITGRTCRVYFVLMALDVKFYRRARMQSINQSIYEFTYPPILVPA